MGEPEAVIRHSSLMISNYLRIFKGIRETYIARICLTNKCRIYKSHGHNQLILVAAPSKVTVCCRSLAGIAVSNPAVEFMSVYSKCCVLSGRGFCDGQITNPEESYQCDVSDCDVKNLNKEVALVQWGCQAMRKQRTQEDKKSD